MTAYDCRRAPVFLKKFRKEHRKLANQKLPVESRGQPHTDLKDNVAAVEPGPELPLVHVTAMGFGRDIILSGQLKATPCKVFGRELLYFFLGRPAYRLRGEDTSSRQLSRYPCVFVVDPSRVDPTQVYPFDTGAAFAGHYENADPFLGIKDYVLDGTIEGARRQLAFGFDSVEDYFDGRLKPGLTTDTPEFHQATRSYELIANQANRGVNDPTSYDDRASAIEVATDRHLDLKGAVELAVLPKQFLEGSDGSKNSELISKLQELEIQTDLYDWQSTRSPADFRAELNLKVLEHVKRRDQDQE